MYIYMSVIICQCAIFWVWERKLGRNYSWLPNPSIFFCKNVINAFVWDLNKNVMYLLDILSCYCFFGTSARIICTDVVPKKFSKYNYMFGSRFAITYWAIGCNQRYFFPSRNNVWIKYETHFFPTFVNKNVTLRPITWELFNAMS